MNKQRENQILDTLPETIAAEFQELYRQMQTPGHKEACRKLFQTSAAELDSTFCPDGT